MSRPRVKYLRGQPMGGYGVIYLEDVEDSSGSSSVRQALFKCPHKLKDCKETFITRIVLVRAGQVQSCG